MKNLEIILGFTFCWFLIGWLFSVLKTKYWYNFLIKKEYVNKYSDFTETPWKIYLPICLIWPIQSLSWVFSDKEKCRRMAITLLGLLKQGTKESINDAIINNKSNYYSRDFSDRYCDNEINKETYIRKQFGLGTLVGGFHLFFWLIGIIVWVIILSISLIINIGFGLVFLFSLTYPNKKEIKEKIPVN